MGVNKVNAAFTNVNATAPKFGGGVSHFSGAQHLLSNELREFHRASSTKWNVWIEITMLIYNYRTFIQPPKLLTPIRELR